MGSRRTTHPSLGNGRSNSVDDTNGSSRPSGCSYISNVRPENRSTLCSMMAQLTEETQPSFETTVKSKAVSENSNVKFSCVVTGHPAPQVIWYKDDVQLDRYCGLPKYEIFRNGQNHSLHIYNCTVEDAAMYQASASNLKGIVSCSGVLEVGEMNEFKIHQRYFAKIKQKAESRRREAEGKENQEPLRTISPDRTQRKRRSTMESFLSTPSSTEDDSMEESNQVIASETEARLQEATVEEMKEKLVTITNGAVSAVIKGQAISENGRSEKSEIRIYDSAQKIFTAHQPRTPFVKKKIKISNSAKVAKSDAPALPASEQRRAKDETSASSALACKEPVQSLPGEQTPPLEKRSPLLNRKKMTPEIQAPSQQSTEEIHTAKTEGKPTDKDKHDPFKAPQVIRKIRAETFADASGHLKLWCQFFNVLSDSTIKWYRNEEGITQIKRNAGDETQVNLAILQASCKDSGVYGCTITNEYGTDSTDFLAGMSLREDLGVGEEIEMTPLIFSKGVGDSGIWGNKFFGRIMMKESHIGDGCSHKVWRAKVIYGLEPVFESGNTCIIKARNPIAYGGKGESCLIDRNLDITKQVFYMIYRPANTVPYATVEADLTGVYQKYSVLDHAGRIDMRTGSEVEQKCSALQHWIFQWTNGNLLLTRLEGVDTKITNVGIAVKSTGHQGLSVEGNPKVFELFVSQHQCNYFCGLLSLRSLKVMDSLLTPVKPKSSKSPLLQRKMASGSSSPQTGRKAAGSPRIPRKTEQDGRKTPTKQKAET
ncbi:Alpha-protein kinase 3 [Collichthys lucidus]|uniref:non-specific serine/threonine protein kinase n=1 Tax=Collichthys lucidus TaxID=240159 RepID=A0A4U5U6J0_COLLU|nr:Alpha-protein kinase 3 [Collichthys lucidus]